jgi:hypothetical protein
MPGKRQMRVATRVALLFLLSLLALGQPGSADSGEPPGASATPPVIVIGFVGGFVRHDDRAHGVVQLAAHLREDYPSGVYIEVFENHRGQEAHREVLRLLDSNHRGSPSPEEKRNARIIIYGHSWGGSETVTLARELDGDGVPVLLTIQVDSITKPLENDTVIPANVAQAINFYQLDGIVHGRPKIRAADPARTQILGNFRFTYRSNPIHCSGYPWYARTFEKPHIEIECDPRVWRQVDSLIRSKLPPR